MQRTLKTDLCAGGFLFLTVSGIVKREPVHVMLLPQRLIGDIFSLKIIIIEGYL